MLDALLRADEPLMVAGMPPGFDAQTLVLLAERLYAERKAPVLFVAQNDARMAATEAAARFFNPDLEILTLPAWDCLPYDRVSPTSALIAQRMATLATLAATKIRRPRLVLTTINAALQRVPERSVVKAAHLSLAPGAEISRETLIAFLSENGFNRSGQVVDKGEFAVRGGLVDLFPTASEQPVRLDFFGDEVDAVRTFDPASQRTTGTLDALDLKPASEFSLSPAAIARFQADYVATFGPTKGDDPLYEAIKAGRKVQGAEHWLPMFHDRLETLFDYLADARLVLDHQVDEAASERMTATADYYDARVAAYDLQKSGKETGTPLYKPVPARRLYLDESEWTAIKAASAALMLHPFAAPEGEKSVDIQGRVGRNFAPERQDKSVNIYDSVVDHARSRRAAGQRVVFATYSAGAAERMIGVLKDHDLASVEFAENWADIRTLPAGLITVVVLTLESGFETPDLALISEQDILGDRLVRRVTKRRKADNFLKEASALAPGDLVVHTSHGIGRFVGLETVEAAGARHDCLLIHYAGESKLFVPVENIEVLTRFGGDSAEIQLDKLGGVAWQARKAKMKERIREMAEGLIKLAAQREMRDGKRIPVPEALYSEFAARFPFTETDDQLRAISDVTADFARGRPMDRLVCGDVGFGKTEVALRAAFLAVMDGGQVAIVAPTTLLARQHFQTFTSRFRGLPVRIGQLSRLVKQKDQTLTKKEMQAGTLDIVVGTHALLGKEIGFKNLSLLIVDEEQHFGVAHKERLKALRADVHVLTLTATPIPRTLQMAMSGIRDLSIIATPPVDRLAVRTYVMPFDHVVIREALLREHYRGGQSFYVVPRIADLKEVTEFLKDHVPEVKFAVAHGQMSPTEIENVMTAFYEGQFDVLLSTTIVESGIDIPTANTMIVHRADMFGLAQLYQLRGRVGRSKVRAYAYLTVPANRLLTDTADKRLQVLQSLDTLGAGFTLASHDMDIRGAGNLLGDEQSGHIKEVGVELYQKMLEEAVAEAKSGKAGEDDGEYEAGDWSPTLNLGATVMIPETYVSDLTQRMALYRRLADLETRADVDAFMAELIDRFGPLPGAVKQLAAIMIIKGNAKRAGIEKLEAGPKGFVIAFRDNRFANPKGLIDFISQSGRSAKVRPDHSLIYFAKTDKTAARLKLAHSLTRKLGDLASKA